MDISNKASYQPDSGAIKGNSFAESLHKEGAVEAPPQFVSASAKSFSAGDLAAGLGSMSPDFMPAMGEGMLDAIAMGEGANDEMRRNEEEVKYR